MGMGMSSSGRGAVSRLLGLLGAAGAVLGSTVGQAQAAGAAGLDSGGTAWVLVASALVLFMTLPGLALFYGGLVRARNLLSVLMHCFVISCVVSLLWVVFGYSLVFADGNPLIGSLNDAFLSGVRNQISPNGVPTAAIALF